MCTFQRWVEFTQYLLDSSVQLASLSLSILHVLTAGILQSASVALCSPSFKVYVSFHLSHASILDVSAQDFPLNRT